LIVVLGTSKFVMGILINSIGQSKIRVTICFLYVTAFNLIIKNKLFLTKIIKMIIRNKIYVSIKKSVKFNNKLSCIKYV